ncbi:SpoIIE family protein phosphatase [Neptunicella sp. SCSIO 80796]|uniref:SpoIIE family protein phosphatase n=1 Tax=Neptunicella plasticusilytica TaxID=3117012 RepID=UPI003A4D4170
MPISEILHLNLLVVDDDKLFADMICGFLAEKAMLVSAAYSLEKAKQHLISQQVDFVLLDILLGEESGIELLDYMAEVQINLPVIMITAKDDQNTMQQCFRKGANDYLIKPLNLDLMWLKIKRVYNSQILQEQVVTQSEELKKLIDVKEAEEELARHVYEYLSGNASRSCPKITSLMLSSSMFNGDFLISDESPTGNVYVLLLDATGHGLAAAISVLPLVSVFPAMVAKGLDLPLIAYELNRKISQSIPDDRFVACILMCLELHTRSLKIWNGGMPDILVLDKKGRFKQRIPSSHMPLGILESQHFEADIDVLKISADASHVVFYSDGLIEQTSPEQQYFGMNGLLEVIEQCTEPAHLIPFIETKFSQFKQQEEQRDDVSICHMNLDALLATANVDQEQRSSQKHKSSVGFEMILAGKQLISVEPMALLDSLMEQTDMSIELRKRTYTVCAELFSNALDHGILKVDSKLKTDASGFIDYINQRDIACQNLTESDQIKVQFRYEEHSQQVSISVTDTGHGYTHQPSSEQELSALSGRGLILIQTLSEQIQRNSSGNQTSVVIK